MVVDDIDVNRGFSSFTQSFSGFHALVCEAEPVRPDLRRNNKKGMFGIILKNSSVAHSLFFLSSNRATTNRSQQ